MSGVLVEPMIIGGIETLVGVVQEPAFGPVVVFGLGGIAAGVLDSHAARLAPLADTDAEDLIRAIRAAPVLLWKTGSPTPNKAPCATPSFASPGSPTTCPRSPSLTSTRSSSAPDGVIAVDVRIRVTSRAPRRPVPAPAPPMTVGGQLLTKPK